MRVNTAKSIETANTVHSRFGSWKAAKDAASFEGGKFVLRAKAGGKFIAADYGAEPKPKKG